MRASLARLIGPNLHAAIPRSRQAGPRYAVYFSSAAAKAFSFLDTRSDFLTVTVFPALLAMPSAALGDLAS